MRVHPVGLSQVVSVTRHATIQRHNAETVSDETASTARTNLLCVYEPTVLARAQINEVLKSVKITWKTFDTTMTNVHQHHLCK